MGADTLAVTLMYRRLEGPLFRKCRAVLQDDELARDAAQEVFVKLCAAAPTLRDPEAELAWALQAAQYHCLNLLRGAERRVAREAGGAEEAQVQSPVTSRQLVRNVLAGMSETSRALVVGSVVKGEEHAELAAQHQVSKKTVSRKLRAALDQARSMLKRRGKG